MPVVNVNVQTETRIIKGLDGNPVRVDVRSDYIIAAAIPTGDIEYDVCMHLLNYHWDEETKRAYLLHTPGDRYIHVIEDHQGRWVGEVGIKEAQRYYWEVPRHHRVEFSEAFPGVEVAAA